MTIRCTNSAFESVADGDFETVEDAYQVGLVSALKIAGDEIAAGMPSSIVEIAVDLVGQRDALLGALAVSTARLMGRSAVTEHTEHSSR